MALKSYATIAAQSRGRHFPESESKHRSIFLRDRDRIIHSSAFRRLKHKTQVFVEHEGDYFRTRLTHSLEVAQVSRSLANALGGDPDLAEAIALAHDLGHPPFGHTGEDALDLMMAPFGGYDHNAQALRIITKLEERYAEFDGLNLSWETLEGIAKHNGPVTGVINPILAACDAIHKLELHSHAGLEAQIAAIGDDIAYNTHDLEDGLRAGLFTPEELLELPLIGACFREVDQLYPDISVKRRRHEALRRFFGLLVEDVIDESQSRLEKLAPASVSDIRMASSQMIALSQDVYAGLQDIRKFLFTHMYRHWAVQRMRKKAKLVVTDLFEIFAHSPELLPPDWFIKTQSDEFGKERVIADYISGMTDRFAIKEHMALTGPMSPVL